MKKNNHVESFEKLNPTQHRQRRRLLLVFPRDYLYRLKSMKKAPWGEQTRRGTQLIRLRELPCGNRRNGAPAGEMADMKALAAAGDAS